MTQAEERVQAKWLERSKPANATRVNELGALPSDLPLVLPFPYWRQHMTKPHFEA